MAKSKTPMLVLPCTWGTAGIGKETHRLGTRIARSSLTLSRADKELCGKRLTCVIVAVPGNDNPDQPGLPGSDAEVSNNASIDVKSLHVTKKYISFGLTFSPDDMPGNRLQEFVARAGRIEVMEIAAIPDGGEDE
jgi:hypothetical protein